MHDATRVPAVLCLLLLSVLWACACSGRPPVQVAQGEKIQHEEAAFSLIAPPSWQVTNTAQGLSLVRTAPYGGGFPSLNIRRVNKEEAEVLGIKGQTTRVPSGTVDYRYQRWSNSRGQGYRLEALFRTSDGLLFADASVWDPGTQINRQFFEDEFWPILNSVTTSGSAVSTSRNQ